MRKAHPAVQRRRFERFALDVPWFVESKGCSTLGRGLQVSTRGVLLPVACVGPFSAEVNLYLSLPESEPMLKLRCKAEHPVGRGWVLHFLEVTADDARLLEAFMVKEFNGLPALSAGAIEVGQAAALGS